MTWGCLLSETMWSPRWSASVCLASSAGFCVSLTVLHLGNPDYSFYIIDLSAFVPCTWLFAVGDQESEHFLA